MNKDGLNLSTEAFRNWLAAYGGAWQARDVARFCSLFAEDALYYWTPFEKPKRGRTGIAEAFAAATARQRDIEFGARVLYTRERVGVAHWSCALTRTRSSRRVHLDGMIMAEFNDRREAASFREWWHADER